MSNNTTPAPDTIAELTAKVEALSKALQEWKTKTVAPWLGRFANIYDSLDIRGF
jgi:hypothetical protein